METTDLKNRFIEHRAKGMSLDKLSKKLGKSKATLVNWSRELEEEIAAFRAVELEALYEKFYLTKELKIRTFGGMLQKILNELAIRDMSDVATDKLLDLMLKYYAMLKEEAIEPRFLSEDEVAERKAERAVLDGLAGLDDPPRTSRRELKTV